MNIDNCNHTDTEKHQEEKIFLYTTITGNLQLIHLEQAISGITPRVNYGKLY